MDTANLDDGLEAVCQHVSYDNVLHVITKPVCHVFGPDVLQHQHPITSTTSSQKTLLYKHIGKVLCSCYNGKMAYIDINKFAGIMVLGQETICESDTTRELSEHEQIIFDKITELCGEMDIPKISPTVFIKLYELPKDNWKQFDLTVGKIEQLDKMLKLGLVKQREDVVNLIKYEFKIEVEDLKNEMVRTFIEDLKNCKPTVYGYFYYVEPILECEVFSRLINILINYEQPVPKISNYATLDAYSDEEIEAGNFRKTGPYTWDGKGLASKIDTELIKLGSKITIESVPAEDKRLSVKIKGSAAYFILYDDGLAKYSVIYNFGIVPLSLHKLENV